MKAHLGKRGSLDENVIHIRGYQDPPSHSQESHNRLKDLRKHSRAIKYRTELNPKGKLYPQGHKSPKDTGIISPTESPKMELKLTTNAKVVSVSKSEGKKKDETQAPIKEDDLPLMFL